MIKDFNKVSDLDNIGESWEISGVEGFVSIVSNGQLLGKSLTQLIDDYKSDFLGEKIHLQFGSKFPLLFKFLDASEDLSIQLHPNDTLAKKRHNTFGKTEMWYVLDAEKKSKIYAGLQDNYNQDSLFKEISKGHILEVLREEQAEKNAVYMIHAGTVHAIGKGIVIAEIQQTSDITYRLYDWNRTDEQGTKRELHIDLALDAIDYTKNKTCKVRYTQEQNQPNSVVSCGYFTTNKWTVTKALVRDLTTIDSFVVYMCIEGALEIAIGNNVEKMLKGDTVLIPAQNDQVAFNPIETAQLIEVYIQ